MIIRFFLQVFLLLSFMNSARAGSWEFKFLKFNKTFIRSGIKKHNTDKFKGSILYYQGLGDSMLNHGPLFNYLNDNGYDVIAFDYQGQGGSSGSMNKTTIKNINELGDLVWKKFGLRQSKKIIIGWSTGGLAAYRYSNFYPDKTKAVVLLAPGIVPKLFIGETDLLSCLKRRSNQKGKCKLLKITEKTLTQKDFQGMMNPHIDKIRPISPIVVPMFASNLIGTSIIARMNWRISKKVKGMVYLSSDNDRYVNAKKTIEVLKKNASHFEYHQFGNGALHELDNEIDPVAEYLKSDLIRFLSEI